jgi:hypothetical protein
MTDIDDRKLMTRSFEPLRRLPAGPDRPLDVVGRLNKMSGQSGE